MLADLCDSFIYTSNQRIRTLHIPVTLYKINHAKTHVLQWDLHIVPIQLDFPRSWMFHCVTCIPAWLIFFDIPPLLISTHIVIELGALDSQATVPFIHCQQSIVNRGEWL